MKRPYFGNELKRTLFIKGGHTYSEEKKGKGSGKDHFR